MLDTPKTLVLAFLERECRRALGGVIVMVVEELWFWLIVRHGVSPKPTATLWAGVFSTALCKEGPSISRKMIPDEFKGAKAFFPSDTVTIAIPPIVDLVPN